MCKKNPQVEGPRNEWPPLVFPGPPMRTYGVCLYFPGSPKDPTPTDGTSHVAVWSCCTLDPTFHISLLTSWVIQAPFWGALPTTNAWLLGSWQSFAICGDCAGKAMRQGWAWQVGALGINVRERRSSRSLKTVQQRHMQTRAPSYGNSTICSLSLCTPAHHNYQSGGEAMWLNFPD